eukprot:11359395-Ditylum_brightwellii.AAC.1
MGAIANCGIGWGWWCSHRGAFDLLPVAVPEREHVVFHDQDKAVIECLEGDIGIPVLILA